MKRDWLLIVIFALLLVGCENETQQVENNENNALENETILIEENVSVEEDIIETVEENVSVEIPEMSHIEEELEAIYDLINFNFKSKNGRYYNSGYYYADDVCVISQHVEDKTLLSDLQLMNDYITNQEFEKTKEIMKRIPNTSQFAIEMKANFLIPLFMAEGNYKDAMRIVLRKSQYDIRNKVNLRADLNYLSRYLYLNKGFDEARRVVDELREEFKINDLSYVWFAVTVSNYDDIMNEGFEYTVEADSKQEKLLRDIIDEYPDEPYLDFAFYLLGDNETIVNDYKKSELCGRAQYKIARDQLHALNKAYYEQYDYYVPIEENEFRFDEEALDKAINEVKKYYSSYLDEGYVQYMTSHVTRVLSRDARLTGNFDRYFDLIDFLRIESKKSLNFDQEIYSIANNLAYTFERTTLVPYDEALIERIKGYHDIEYADYRLLKGLAQNAFTNDQFILSKKYFDMIPYDQLDRIIHDDSYYYYYYYDAYTMAERRRDILYNIERFFGKEDKDSLIAIANELKDQHEETLAIKYYERAEALELSDNERSKINMYKAYCYRENNDFQKMYECHEYIAENLPNSEYADDALAEMGVYYLLYDKYPGKARKIFKDVIKKYPNRNAENNAYNWIAWSYLQEENYPAALRAYETLRDKFPTNRYGINARRNIKKILDLGYVE